jgi:hypothetical protein
MAPLLLLPVPDWPALEGAVGTFEASPTALGRGAHCRAAGVQQVGRAAHALCRRAALRRGTGWAGLLRLMSGAVLQ